jgi:hypothetical protein
MDLSRVKTKEKIIIKQEDRYPDMPVLTTVPYVKGKRHVIKLNRKAIDLLGVGDNENNRLIMFEQYNISTTDETEYDSVIGVVSESTVKADKQHKSYEIHLPTRCIKSKQIHNSICQLFEINELKQHDFQIKYIDGIVGAFTLSYIASKDENEDVIVEVDFNKGESIFIKEQQ